MTDMIQRIEGLEFDVDKLVHDYEVVRGYPHGRDNQVGLTCRPGAEDPWRDAAGTLGDKIPIPLERDFTEFNPHLVGLYIHHVYLTLCDRFRIGRSRIMKLPSIRGYTMHRDTTKRIHVPIITGPDCLFIEALSGRSGLYSAVCHHIPADGGAYMVDTTRRHSAHNGSWHDRVHLLFALCEEP
jgi:hypothetical protein